MIDCDCDGVIVIVIVVVIVVVVVMGDLTTRKEHAIHKEREEHDLVYKLVY